MSALRSVIGLLRESMIGLSRDESKLLGLMTGKKKLSDKTIRTAMGLEQGLVIKMAAGLRSKLGVPKNVALRDHLAKSNKSQTN